MTLRSALITGVLLSAAVLPGSPSTKSGVDLVNLDPAVRPQDDLFRYVNGAWLATAEIPTDHVTWGTFAEMAERTDRDLRTIAENAARSNVAAGTPARQIGDFYRSAMDEDRLTALGAEPVRAQLERFAAIRTREEFAFEAGRLTSLMAGGPFGNSIVVDAKDSSRLIVEIPQGGTMLPNRDYYLNTDVTSNALQRMADVECVLQPGLERDHAPGVDLQPPIFDADADDAANYGAIGALIGPELSHALDDRGQGYDARAMPRQWWTPPDLQRFRESAHLVAEQYDAYSPLPGLRVNGEFTLTENLADVTGVSLAYRAYLLSLKGQPPPVLDRFTGPQRFFMGWAAMWRSKVRDGYMRQWLLTLSYSPYEYRANGPVSHLAGFHEAFGVTDGDKLFRSPSSRVRMW